MNPSDTNIDSAFENAIATIRKVRTALEADADNLRKLLEEAEEENESGVEAYADGQEEADGDLAILRRPLTTAEVVELERSSDRLGWVLSRLESCGLEEFAADVRRVVAHEVRR